MEKRLAVTEMWFVSRMFRISRTGNAANDNILLKACAGSGVVRIDPLHFLA